MFGFVLDISEKGVPWKPGPTQVLKPAQQEGRYSKEMFVLLPTLNVRLWKQRSPRSWRHLVLGVRTLCNCANSRRVAVHSDRVK